MTTSGVCSSWWCQEGGVFFFSFLHSLHDLQCIHTPTVCVQNGSIHFFFVFEQVSPVVWMMKVIVFRGSSMLPHSCSCSIVPWVRMKAVVFRSCTLLCCSCSCSVVPWVRMMAVVFESFSLLCCSCSCCIVPWGHCCILASLNMGRTVEPALRVWELWSCLA